MREELPLAGLSVMDFSQYLAGPTATLRLADLGASVCKIERPGTGEAGRGLGIGTTTVDGDSFAFHSSNRNKQSIALDLKSPAGAQTALELISQADVVVENFRPGVMGRLGLDFDTVRKINSRLVYGRVTGYGDEGPWRDLPGQDLLVQAVSGMTWLGGTAADPPTPFPLSVVDVMAGQLLAQGLLAGLIRRFRDGRGALIEVSLLEAAVELQSEVLTAHLNDGGKVPDRSAVSAAHPYVAAPYGIYRTRDGWVALAMAEVPKIGALLDIAELGSYVDSASWFIHRDEIKRLIVGRVECSTTAELLAVLRPAGVWAMEVLSWPQLLEHDGVRDMRLTQDVHRSGGVTIRTTRCPIRIDGRILTADRGAPKVGENEL